MGLCWGFDAATKRRGIDDLVLLPSQADQGPGRGRSPSSRPSGTRKRAKHIRSSSGKVAMIFWPCGPYRAGFALFLDLNVLRHCIPASVRDHGPLRGYLRTKLPGLAEARRVGPTPFKTKIHAQPKFPQRRLLDALGSYQAAARHLIPCESALLGAHVVPRRVLRSRRGP